MKNLNSDLNNAEFDRLNQFLLDRIDDDADTEGKDEGVLEMSELDGFFTALVSGPVMIPPSQWLPVVWGDFAPVWESKNEFEEIFSLMIRHLNGIATRLMEQPQDFEPLFQERTVNGKTYLIVDDWCEGFSRGVELAAGAWEAGGMEMRILMAPILAFTRAANWRGHELDEKEMSNAQQAITPNVRAIHAFWLARRDKPQPTAAPMRQTKLRVGRNDPCHCGSGKKYKKCCLH